MENISPIRFDSENHIYTNEDGYVITGLTSLLRKHGLSKTFENIPYNVLKNAADRGTNIHLWCQMYDETGMIPTCFGKDIDKWSKPYVDLKLDVIESEFLVNHENVVATFIDKILVDYSICDIKTSSVVDQKSLSWQLSVGAYMLEKQYGIKVPNIYLIHLRDGSSKLSSVERVSDEEIEKLFWCEEHGIKYYDNVEPSEPKSVFDLQPLPFFENEEVSTSSDNENKIDGLALHEDVLPSLQPFLQERNILNNIYGQVILMDSNNPNTASFAKELRLKIRDNRTKGIEAWHKRVKDYFLQGGRFVDSIKKKEIAINLEMESVLKEIENVSKEEDLTTEIVSIASDDSKQDKEKLEKLLKETKEIVVPEFATKEAQAKAKKVSGYLQKIISELEK